MKRLTQIALVGVFLLAVVSIAVAQQALQPVLRLGNFTEVGNDVFMHLIATSEMRYETMENRDFERHVRDRPLSRFPNDTATQASDMDAAYFQNRIGVEARYQKSLEFYLLFEHRSIVDGNLIDDRANSTNPGGRDVFGDPAATENSGFHTERYYIRYKFAGTPLKLHVGADLWNVDQAGIIGDDDPRIALFADFGDFDAMAAAVIQYESQRIGLENDNDNIYYTFSVGYDLRPHRFQFDVVYMRDRFAGADLSFPRSIGNPIGFQGQKNDSVLVGASWSGRLGPVRALLQANGVFGRAKGGTAGLTGFPSAIAGSQTEYDILAGAGLAYVEADLGIVRPFVAFVMGSPDGDPTDRQLRGFSPASWQDVTQITGVSFFESLDTSTNFAGRDYACPARLEGVRTAPNAATGPRAIGTQVFTGGGDSECSHSVTNAFNQRLGFRSHPGITSAYSNPGTLVIAPGVKVSPARGHEIAGGYVYRAMLDTGLLERAFVVGIDPGFTGKFDKAQVHELWGFWQWTLNPHFDIRLAGNAALLGEGYLDLAKLADCGQQAFQGCNGKATALKGEARFRARF